MHDCCLHGDLLCEPDSWPARPRFILNECGAVVHSCLEGSCDQQADGYIENSVRATVALVRGLNFCFDARPGSPARSMGRMCRTAAAPASIQATRVETISPQHPEVHHAADETLEFNQRNIAEFRSSGGKIAAFGDAPVLLLTTVGAKTGNKRTSPTMYLADERDAGRGYVFASAAGADRNPAWFHNILAHPDDLEIEIGIDRLKGAAEVVWPERSEVYAIQAGRFPGFVEYEAETSRLIPVIAIHLRDGSSDA